MADQEQLERLKAGVEGWNKWREENRRVNIELRDADLSKANLKGVDFRYHADLRGANFDGADLREANLREADLRDADLIQADLRVADLRGADLRGTMLMYATFVVTNLLKAEITAALLGHTIFGETNLSDTLGLDKVIHTFSSVIDSQTLQFSKGRIPDVFLRGCGLSDWEIESAKLYNPDLTNEEIVKIQYRMFDLRATRAIQISPLFISYSHVDTAFVDQLEKSLTDKGVRFWRDIHDAKVGRLETQIDRAIRQNPTVLLVLSKNSLASDWVEHEVRHARKLEKELGRDVLCPVALDDSWISSKWPERLMEQVMEYNILDFSGWEDETTFDSNFAKLLSGLDLFYKKPSDK